MTFSRSLSELAENATNVSFVAKKQWKMVGRTWVVHFCLMKNGKFLVSSTYLRWRWLSEVDGPGTGLTFNTILRLTTGGSFALLVADTFLAVGAFPRLALGTVVSSASESIVITYAT